MAVVIPERMSMLEKNLDCLFHNQFIEQFWCLSASEFRMLLNDGKHIDYIFHSDTRMPELNHKYKQAEEGQ